MHPRFPIYVISYKRWDSRLTVKALEEMQVDYKVVVDDFDYDKYAQVIDTKKILVLPNEYRKNYDTFWQDGGTTGSGAARNFVWDHAVASNSQFHWILDDNIDGFVRLHQNKKIKVLTGAYFRCMEDFVLRYENVALAGPHYRFFAANRDKLPPFQVNTRVFSCILIRNDIPFRWRGRYNEDVDLSLRVLKAGWCTILFYAFLQNKAGTQSVKGGNTDEFYSKEGTFKK